MKYILFGFSLLMIFSACTNQRKFTYFRDISDTVTNFRVSDTGYKSLTIKRDDLLQINISSPNPEASSYFITQGTNNPASDGSPVPQGAGANTYLVDEEGGIDLPLIGRVMLQGLTTTKAKALIRQKAERFLKEPIITVRIHNFKVTVLGEVNRPANYIVPNERISILDAIGLAGDLTIFGRRENVLLIREHEGKKVFTRFDLNNSRIFQSPHYYLQQNDIVYVEPNKSKVASSDLTAARNISIITSLASLATIIITQVKF